MGFFLPQTGGCKLVLLGRLFICGFRFSFVFAYLIPLYDYDDVFNYLVRLSFWVGVWVGFSFKGFGWVWWICGRLFFLGILVCGCSFIGFDLGLVDMYF